MIRIVMWVEPSIVKGSSMERSLRDFGEDARGLVAREASSGDTFFDESQIEWLPRSYPVGSVSPYALLFDIELYSGAPRTILAKAEELKSSLKERLASSGSFSHEVLEHQRHLLRLRLEGRVHYI